MKIQGTVKTITRIPTQEQQQPLPRLRAQVQ